MGNYVLRGYASYRLGSAYKECFKVSLKMFR